MRVFYYDLCVQAKNRRYVAWGECLDEHTGTYVKSTYVPAPYVNQWEIQTQVENKLIIFVIATLWLLHDQTVYQTHPMGHWLVQAVIVRSEQSILHHDVKCVYIELIARMQLAVVEWLM